MAGVDSKSDPFQLNISGVRNLVDSGLNKVQGFGPNSNAEGVKGERVDILDLDMTDGELLKLAHKWELRWTNQHEPKLKLRQQANEVYYLGRQKMSTPQAVDDVAAISANLIFEAVETFLPAALSKNPTPVVWSDNSPEGNALSNSVQTMLQYHTDQLALRSKLALMTRKWSLDFLGVLKHGWNNETQEIKTEVRDAKNMVFDPDGYVDVLGDFSAYLGERITVTAEKLIEMFPKKKDVIILRTDGQLGTACVYTEWWTDEMCFYTFKDIVLDSHKNPHFNYSQEEQEESTDDEGNVTPAQDEVMGKNHFAKPYKPYTFLSVFNLQQGPFDVTGLVEQNIPNQRLISRRTDQLDFNLSRANNSTVFSEENFNQQTAKQAATGWLKGHPILVPPGRPIQEAIMDFPPPTVPDAFFTDLENSMNNLRSVFGVQGITAQNVSENQTARGMILNQQYDNSRIGGGIGDKLEMVARNVFNWWVQLYYVYYDETHFASIVGQLKATEYIELSNQHLTARLVISVAPDSMKPHDQITEMNQALSLWEAGAIDPQTLLTRLNFPNPKETAAQFMLYKLNPQTYFVLNFPEEAQAAGMMPQPQQGQAQQPQQGQGQPQPLQPPAQPGSTGGVPATAALSSVPLPQ